MVDYLGVITRLRKAKGWTEYKLAERSGVPQSTISSWYCKKAVPTVLSLEKVCKALGITLSELFGEGDAFFLTRRQQKLLALWATLDEEQQDALFNLLVKWRKD